MEQLKFSLYEEELVNPLRGHKLTEAEEYVASLLLKATNQQPITIKEIINNYSYQFHKSLSQRDVKDTIRTLRREHLFPILSSRRKPYGLWWCASAEEMEAFIQMFRSQALDELHTLSKIVRHSYPTLLGQLNLAAQSHQEEAA